MAPDPEITNAAPPTLDHVIGQKRAVAQLRVALDAYFNDRTRHGDKVALPHLLFVGPPGVGKSLLSGIIAREIGSNLHEELAQNLYTPGHVHGIMMMLERGDVLFVDELHDLDPIASNTLLRCLEERRLFLGGNRAAVTLPPFTFVGATTDQWALSKPFRDRFRIVLHLEHYSDDEIAVLIEQRSKRLGWAIDKQAVLDIAPRGRGTPRIAIRLLEASRRVARAEDAEIITVEHVARMCEVEGVDPAGLDRLERRYMELLREAKSPVRLNVLATQLALPKRTIEAVIESELIRLGLVTKSDEGRMLTAAGAAHLSSAPGDNV